MRHWSLFPAILLVALSAIVVPAIGAPVFNGVEIGQGARYAREFMLTDHDGKRRSLSDFRGKAVVLFFGYLQCPNYCPTTLARMADVMKRLDDDAGRVQVLFVTLDPERDPPAALREYVLAFHPSFLALSAAPADTPRLALDFRVYFKRVPDRNGNGYHIDHAVFSYAYDANGRLRLRLSDGLSAAAIAADLRRLLSGS